MRNRGFSWLVVLSVLIVMAFVISMNSGSIHLSLLDVGKTLFGGGTAKQHLILFHFRLPRIMLSILVGAGLAVSGCMLQGLTRNALADPGILGINAGAGFMVMIFISFLSASALTPLLLLPLMAIAGAAFAAVLIYLLAYRREQGLLPTRLILTGVAIAAGLSSATLVMSLRLKPEKYQFVATWFVGNIWGTNWTFVAVLLPWIVILLPYALYKAKVLDVFQLGEQTAKSLGLDVNRERIKLLAAAVALSGASVAIGGGIVFVGMIGPHLARQLVGPRHRLLLPGSALIGALLLIAADTIGRLVIPNMEIPTGIVVAVIGAPYFLYLLAKAKA
ncbi:iron ABC transporter permease [Paenibacillus sp. yr247]|uniref:FecCD family ABC transporter permease n=1 Tax=Paenibacillus sp. yr247 TaxID=1761880 RepID=UPI0020C8E9F0|nr:iron ABC transporter permease [Paenibacillus sp. yr247]